jgi:putative PIN family toxin of toxin-antitoxin system
MSLGDPEKVVFDCTVFAQALISPNGPAAACLTHAQRGNLKLFVSHYVFQEIRELPSKIRPKYGVTDEKVERLIQDLSKYAQFVDDVPAVYNNPFDPDDSHYVDLAVETKSKLIVSRDPHLLKLADETLKEAKELKELFPELTVMTPDALAEHLRADGVRMP